MQLVREVVLEGAAVDHEGAGAGHEARTGDGLLAAADGRAGDVQDGAGRRRGLGGRALGGEALGSLVDGICDLSHCVGVLKSVRRTLLGDLVEGVNRGLLSSVGVLGTRVHLQLLDLGAAQRVLRQHAADGLLDGTRRVLLDHLGVGRRRQAARVARVAVVELLGQLGAGEGHLVGVDDDDEVAHVHVGGEGRLVLAAQQGCHVAGETAEDDVVRVDDQPVRLDVSRLGGESARHSSAASWSR